MIVQFVETMTGIRAVQAYRREPRNAEIFDDLADRYRDANIEVVPAGRDLHAGRAADRQRDHRRRAAVRRLRAVEGEMTDRRARPPSCSTCGCSSSRCRRSASSTTCSSRRRLRWRSSRACSRRNPRLARQPARPAAGGARRPRVRQRVLRLRAGARGAAGVRRCSPAGSDRRAGRHHRRRQDHHREAHDAVLRPDRRPGAARRCGPARPGRR